ncbi:MAG: NAD(P)-dependent oxidoreductase [Calditrichaeota bacterium]|nr:MAG: NAD(P)-dependent oxidoreductase [Calditrichota bacterium]
MRYFVTGATGFIGSWVAQFLVEKGEEVTCLIRESSNLRWLKELPVELVKGSLFQPETLKEAIKQADYVLHIAGVTKALSIEDYYRGNVDTTRNLMELIRGYNPGIKKLVFLSSQAAVGPSLEGRALVESDPPHPISDYGRSKLKSEEVVLKYQNEIPVTILRPPAVYGPRDSDILNVFKNIHWGVNLKVGIKDQVVSIIHVHDLARGIILAAELPQSAGETYFICNDEPVAWSEVTYYLQDIMNKKRVITISIPPGVARGIATLIEFQARLRGKPTILNRQKIAEVDAQYWVISNEKIKNQLHFVPHIPLYDGLFETWRWYRQMGWL